MRRILELFGITVCFILLAGSSFAQTLNPQNGHWYQVVNIPPDFTWHQCRDSAYQMGGYLATADSKAENDFLAKSAEPYETFLGGTDEGAEGNWSWINGEEWNFTAWRSGEPNNHWPDEDYIGLSSIDSLWNDSRNWFTVPGVFIAEWDYNPNLGNIIYVPSDYTTIQEAINIAYNMDTILVAAGTYKELIDFTGKAICLKSEAGAENTILTYPTRCDNLIKFTSCGDTLSILDGFTILNVSHNLGCVKLDYSSGTIKNCVFVNTTNFKPSPSSWGAIGMFDGGFLIVENCYFEGNQSYGPVAIGVAGGEGRFTGNTFINNNAYGAFGGAIGPSGTNILIEENIFINNHAASQGGAIFIGTNTNTIVKNNTFIGNVSDGNDGGAICIWYYSSGIQIYNNIFLNNSGYAVTNQHGSSASLNYNNTWGNTPEDYAGNINPGLGSFTIDPQICDANNNSYFISECSPCVPSNNYSDMLIGALGIGCTLNCSTVCGDANNDESIDILDIVMLINYLYKNGYILCINTLADANGDYDINILDVVFLINNKYKDGPEPVCP